MKTSSLYLALGAAHLAACAPTTTTTTTTPVVILADHLKALAPSHAAASAQDATSTSTSTTTTTYWIPDGDRGDPASPHPGRRPAPRKNHHSHSDPLPPPPPSEEEHRRERASDDERHGGRRRTGRGPRRGHRKVDLVPLRITVNDGGEGGDGDSGKETQVVDVGVPSEWLSGRAGRGPGSPYPYSPPRHGSHSGGVAERNDVLVVLLVAAFVVFVVLVETWESLFRRQGGIRLEDTPGQLPLPASVRAVPGGRDDPGDEKRQA